MSLFPVLLQTMNRDLFYLCMGNLTLSILLVVLYLCAYVQAVLSTDSYPISILTGGMFIANIMLLAMNDFDLYEYLVYIKLINNKVDAYFIQMMTSSDFLER